MARLLAWTAFALLALTVTVQAAEVCCDLLVCCDGGPCCDD